jgi:hypothetical protein
MVNIVFSEKLTTSLACDTYGKKLLVDLKYIFSLSRRPCHQAHGYRQKVTPFSSLFFSLATARIYVSKAQASIKLR